MSGEAQILTWAVADLLHCSNIPSFPYCVTGVFHRCTDGPHTSGDGPGARAIVQNKANFQRPESMLIAVQRKGYKRKGRILLLQEQSQFPSLARGAPVGAWEGSVKCEVSSGRRALQTSHFTLPKKRLTASLRTGAACKTKPISAGRNEC